MADATGLRLQRQLWREMSSSCIAPGRSAPRSMSSAVARRVGRFAECRCIACTFFPFHLVLYMALRGTLVSHAPFHGTGF